MFKEEDPSPGEVYRGTQRTAYLPNNPEGEKVLNLLKKAWNLKLIFKIGKPAASGQPVSVIWNNISHKTNLQGGSEK